MLTDQAPDQEKFETGSPEGSRHALKFMVIFALMAALAIAEVITLGQLSTLKNTWESQRATMQKELSAAFNERLAAFESSNTQELEALKQEIGNATKRTGVAGRELKKARAQVAKLEDEQHQQAEALRQEIALKADQQQLGVLTQDLSSTKTDLDNTRKDVASVRSDLGMARSEFGTLIARNHDEIEQLRKLGERDYFEFALERNRANKVAGVGLVLKGTNVKRHRFNLNLVVDDMTVEKKGRGINEPIFFYVAGSKRPYELVVNKVESKQVRGYLSTPKGIAEMASRSEGAR